MHVHSKDGSDGNYTIEQIFQEAQARNIELLSITDHDSIAAQARAVELANDTEIKYIVGIELNVTYSHPEYRNGKEIYLDFLGYQFDYTNKELNDKLQMLREYREQRARKILDKMNVEFEREGRASFTESDIEAIKATVDGAFGRPHIADYLIKKGIVKDRQEAFDRYLVKCYEPEFPLKLPEASNLIKAAGGILVLAHGSDPSGTSLVKLTESLDEQTKIIEENFLEYIDGIEVWHSRHDERIIEQYLAFGKKHNLVLTGGSDCHQKPLRIGTVAVPEFVAEQFKV
ncbi:MAG: PHP domain-containing protein [Thermoplasmata archaeon]|nr:PHP domain-containing protein [Thermoplasmata archaeon]